MDLETYIHAALAEKGATAFFQSLSRVCMTVSESCGNSTDAEKIVKQGWLSLSARSAAAGDLAQRIGMGSPFVMRRTR